MANPSIFAAFSQLIAHIKQSLLHKLGNEGSQVITNGDLKIDNRDGQRAAVRLDRYTDETNYHRGYMIVEDDYVKVGLGDSSGEVVNQIELKQDETLLRKPLAVSGGGTGSDAPEEACNALETIFLGRIDSDEDLIASGDDLNNYTTPGVYRASTAAIAGSLANGPVYSSAGFRLMVSANSHASTGVIQMAFYNTTSNYVYYRIQNNSGTWSPWANLMKNVLSVQEYGTSLPTAGTKGRIFFKKA